MAVGIGSCLSRSSAGDRKRGIAPTPLHVVSARLGHASPMVRLSVYAHVLPRSDEHAAESVGMALR
jgi:integrase